MHWVQKAQVLLVGILEVVLVAFFFVVASRYWAISEHVAFISLFAATALIAVSRGITGPVSVRRFLPLIAFALFIGWSVLSSSWSPSFHLSLGRAVTVGLVAATGVAIGFALKPRTVAKGLVLGVFFLVVHATLNSAWHPLRAFFSNNVAERILVSGEPGLFTNISDMTYLLGAGLIASTLLALRSKSTALLAAPVVVLFLLSAIGIPVLTMFFAVAGSTLVGLMVYHLRFSNERVRKVFRIVYPTGVLIGAVIFWLFREPIGGALGADPNLSGRTIIWDWYFEAFLWEPIIGVGWGNTYNWPLTEGDIYPTGGYFIAHNGFLDIGLVTGGVGVILVVATLVFVFLRGSSLVLDRAKSLSYMFIPTMVTYIVVNDIMSTSLPRYIGVFLVGTLVGLVVNEPTKSDVRDAPEPANPKESALRA